MTKITRKVDDYTGYTLRVQSDGTELLQLWSHYEGAQIEGYNNLRRLRDDLTRFLEGQLVD